MPTRDLSTGSRATPPLRIARGAAPLPRRAPAVALRLAIAREGIGIELASPCRVGCAVVTQLTASLPGMRFPVDVSGGVARFRHRWSELQRVEVEIGARALERWSASRLRGLLGTHALDVWVAVARSSATVCIAGLVDAEEHGAITPVVAFDLHVLPLGEDLVLVVAGARGADLPAPATAVAIGCVEAAVGRAAERRGAEFVFASPGVALARALLPEAGARVPSADRVRWSAVAADGDSWILQAARDAIPAAPTEDAVRAHETATLLRVADDLLVAGNIVEARSAYLEALDRAPRQGEVARRIIEIDARSPGRAEAALAMLKEARARGDGEPLGITPGELLLETGDLDGAVASFERVGDAEPAPALGARALEMAARVARDVESSARWLDHALARAPRSTQARWARVEKRLALGRLEDAQADAEHLEALARGSRAKHAVWLRAGRMWQAAGIGDRAAALFERALRFAPDEPAALAGLGDALAAQGQAARGTSLLGRALSLAEERGAPMSAIGLALARALAERLDDLPAAIARAAVIPADAAEAIPARALEGQWRARLGDLAGAGLAFARLRELAASIPEGAGESVARPIAMFLVEAARFETNQRGDPLSARRHLSDALRLLPHDREVRRLYREACGVGGRFFEGAPPPEPEGAPSDATSSHRQAISLDEGFAEGSDVDAERAARVDELTRRVHADPRDDAAADELAGLLEALGRGHELLALLSAGLADAGVERRAVLAPRARAALERLAGQAEAAGRMEEARLYRDAATALAG